MASSDVKYHVKVGLDPTSPPDSNKLVIWSGSSGHFALSEESAPTTVCILDQDQSSGNRTMTISGISSSDNSCLKGEIWGKVQDGSRYQLARVVIGWKDNTSADTNITVVEDVRYPDSRVIYNINSFAVTWSATDTFLITFTQYTTGGTPSERVDYCLNYIVF